jgi:hypothetical protein
MVENCRSCRCIKFQSHCLLQEMPLTTKQDSKVRVSVEEPVEAGTSSTCKCTWSRTNSRNFHNTCNREQVWSCSFLWGSSWGSSTSSNKMGGRWQRWWRQQRW